MAKARTVSHAAGVYRHADEPRVRQVWLIGPESSVYHARADCPALTRPDRYWPVEKGWLLSDGAVKGTALGRYYYENRRPCRRCHG